MHERKLVRKAMTVKTVSIPCKEFCNFENSANCLGDTEFSCITEM